MKVIIRQAVLFFIVILSLLAIEESRSSENNATMINYPHPIESTVTNGNIFTDTTFLPTRLGGAVSSLIVTQSNHLGIQGELSSVNSTGGLTGRPKYCNDITYSRYGLAVQYNSEIERLTALQAQQCEVYTNRYIVKLANVNASYLERSDSVSFKSWGIPHGTSNRQR